MPSLSLYGQLNGHMAHFNQINSNIISKDISFKIADTLKFKQVPYTDEKKNFFNENVSWIIALLIALISVIGNVIVSIRQERKNTLNLKKQIENNESIFNKQIESSKELALTEFKATIAANNRQGWINELRETMSDFLTISLSLSQNDLLTTIDEAKYHKLFYTKFKIDLLLNIENEEHKLLQKAINKLIDVIKNSENDNIEQLQITRDMCLEATRRIIKTEWIRIKELK
jgi:hypothetical protein